MVERLEAAAQSGILEGGLGLHAGTGNPSLFPTGPVGLGAVAFGGSPYSFAARLPSRCGVRLLLLRGEVGSGRWKDDVSPLRTWSEPRHCVFLVESAERWPMQRVPGKCLSPSPACFSACWRWKGSRRECC